MKSHAAQATATPAPPAPATGTPNPQATTVTTPAPASGANPNAVLTGYRAQLRELRNQYEMLERSRRELVGQLRQGTVSDGDRTGIEGRLAVVDQQLAAKQIAIAEAEARVAVAAAVPGANIDPPRRPERISPADVLEMSAVIFTILAIPIVLAWSRRIWRRNAVTVSLTPELAERMQSLERSMDAVAVEVERIGEGQRFVTRLLGEREREAQAKLNG